MKSKCVYPNLHTELTRTRKTQKDLATVLGITEKTLSTKMTGKREFTLKEANTISRLFDQAVDFLFQK